MTSPHNHNKLPITKKSSSSTNVTLESSLLMISAVRRETGRGVSVDTSCSTGTMTKKKTKTSSVPVTSHRNFRRLGVPPPTKRTRSSSTKRQSSSRRTRKASEPGSEPITNSQPHLSTALAYPSCLLFTAPHSIEMYRAQMYSDERTRIHKRERFSAELCLRFSHFARQFLPFFGSFIVWDLNVARKRDKSIWDPNYLRWEDAQKGPFYCEMRKWHEKWMDVVPLLHIDVHGKKDRSHNLDLDVGTLSMQIEGDEDQAHSIRHKLEDKLNALFRPLGIIKRGMPFGVEIDPQLSGYWGEDSFMTLSHQAVRRSLASLQLEIPFTMRKALMDSDELCSQFMRCICEVYYEIFQVNQAVLEERKILMKTKLGGKSINFNALYSNTMDSLLKKDKVDYKSQI